MKSNWARTIDPREPLYVVFATHTSGGEYQEFPLWAPVTLAELSAKLKEFDELGFRAHKYELRALYQEADRDHLTMVIYDKQGQYCSLLAGFDVDLMEEN